VCWTLGKHRIVKTKKEADRVMKVWKDWHRKIGWTVRGNLAYPPDDNVRALRAITLHEYDSETRERVA
jgi:hypothetical protein